MTVRIKTSDAISVERVHAALAYVKGLCKITDKFPNLTLEIEIGEVIIGYEFSYLTAGRAIPIKTRFWVGYLSKDQKYQKIQDGELAAKMYKVLKNVALHEYAIRKGVIPLSDIEAPEILLKIMQGSGLTPKQFINSIGNKMTSWNDGIPNIYGRKVARLPFPVKTAGVFKGNQIKLYAIQAPSGAQVSFIYEELQPVFSLDGNIPTSIAETYIGQPLTRMVEAPELEYLDELLPITSFQHSKFSNSNALMKTVKYVNISQPEKYQKAIESKIKKQVEDWLKTKIESANSV